MMADFFAKQDQEQDQEQKKPDRISVWLTRLDTGSARPALGISVVIDRRPFTRPGYLVFTLAAPRPDVEQKTKYTKGEQVYFWSYKDVDPMYQPLAIYLNPAEMVQLLNVLKAKDESELSGVHQIGEKTTVFKFSKTKEFFNLQITKTSGAVKITRSFGIRLMIDGRPNPQFLELLSLVDHMARSIWDWPILLALLGLNIPYTPDNQ
jgi:hypothetical protein